MNFLKVIEYTENGTKFRAEYDKEYNVYSTEKEALDNRYLDCIATIKIEWEE